MDIYNLLMIKAEKLITKLQSDITTGKKEICENYGQKQIRQFMDKELYSQDLTYQERCNIESILYKVSSIC